MRPLYIVENNKLRITAKQTEDVGSGKLKWDNLFGVGSQVMDVDRKRKRPPFVNNGPVEAVMEWLVFVVCLGFASDLSTLAS